MGAKHSIDMERDGGMAQLVVAVVFGTLAVLAVGLRIISRRLSKSYLQVNDYMIILALASTMCGVGAIIASVVSGGAGKHQDELSEEQIVAYWKSIFVLVITWPITQTAIKISILLFYLQLFITKWFRIASYTTMVVVCLWCIEQILANLLICNPISYNWNFKANNGTCGNTMANCAAGAAINILTDLVILILPMPIIWGLKIPTRSKMGLSCIFGLGFLICTISCFRLSGLIFWSTRDGTYVNSMTIIWTSLESTLGIICACILTMRPLFGKAFPDHLGLGEKMQKFSSSDPSSTSGNRLSPAGWMRRMSQPRGLSGNRAGSHDRLFPLSPAERQIEATNTTTIGVGTPNGTISEFVDVDTQYPKRTFFPGAIIVKREWGVDSLVV